MKWFAALSFCAVLVPVAVGAQSPAPTDAGAPARKAPSTRAALDPQWAAAALDSTLSFGELEELWMNRRAMTKDGRDALQHLVRTRLLDRLAQESRLVVTSEQVQARARAIEKQLIENQVAKSLEQYLREQKVEPAVFREHLRLALVQETLSRRALGIPEGTDVPAEQQEMWLDQIVAQRGTDLPVPPWKDGVAARCGDLVVTGREFLEHLRWLLSADDVRDDCYQLLLVKRMRARMPDLAPEALAKAVEVELERRRAEVAADPKYKGLSYDQLLSSQGVSPSFIPQDPAVLAAALARVWVDRTNGPDGLRAAYEQSREWYDGHFGAAIEARAIFMRAAVLPNQIVPRTFETAEVELNKLAAQVKTEEDFGKLARKHTEDAGTRDLDGRLGAVTSGDERVPQEIRDALFSASLAPDKPPLLGPLRLPSGCVLLWVGAKTPAPSWDEMSSRVHNELRRRFIETVLPRDDVQIYLDAQ
jgi:parvulin-like peptidyl-prolyl isomerase